MLAGYLLKVIEKNTKPPIWRKITLPCGITFSSLSVILNYLLGFEGPAAYEFEFYGRKMQLREKKEGKLFNPAASYDLQSAQDTFIDDYFKSEYWFSYYYKEQSAFRVEIQPVYAEKELIFPFYESCSRAVSDADPEGEESGRRLKSLLTDCVVHYQDAPSEVDPDITSDLERNVLSDLEQDISSDPERNVPSDSKKNTPLNPEQNDSSKLKSNDSFFLTQGEIYDRIRMGKGIIGTHSPVSRPDNIRMCPRHLIDNLSARLAKQIAEVMKEPDGLEKGKAMLEEALAGLQQDVHSSFDYEQFNTDDGRSLREMLFSAYDEKSLRRRARDFGIRNSSSIRHGDLAQRTAAVLLEPDVMREQMLPFSDRAVQTFEKVISKGGEYEAKLAAEITDLKRIGGLDYLFWKGEGNHAVIPSDVMAVYQKINTPEYNRKRRDYAWLQACLNIVYYYYAAIPLTEFCQIYRQNGTGSDDEILRKITGLPEEANCCVLLGNELVDRELAQDRYYKKIQELQKGKPLYIPSVQEIMDLYNDRYPSGDKEWIKSCDTMKREFDISDEEASSAIRDVWAHMTVGAMPHDVFNVLNEHGFVFKSERSVRSVTEMIMKLNNRTRMMIHRGHTPQEISMIAQREAPAQPVFGRTGITGNTGDIGNIGNTGNIGNAGMPGNAKSTKIYPNDPCPCGSGKKYKRCCGR